MNKLRILKIFYGHLSGASEYLFKNESWRNIGESNRLNVVGLLNISNVHLFGHLKNLSNELRCLHWHAYPLKELPSSFCPRNLVELNLSHCGIIKFWTEMKIFNKLKFMKLSYSQELITTPNFTGMPNLEILILEGCRNLVEVHPSIGDLKNLVFLNLKGCSSLWSLPSSINMRSLEILILSGCSKLENLPEIHDDMQMLSELYIDGIAIKELHASIRKLKGLLALCIKDCRRLKNLPRSIGGLDNLKILNLSGCVNLNRLPEDLGLLENLQELHLNGTTVTQIPSSFCLLKKVKLLSFSGCRSQTMSQTEVSRYIFSGRSNSEMIKFPSQLFTNLLSLTSIDLSSCNLLDGAIPDDFCQLTSLRKLNLSRNNFVVLPSAISELPRLEVLLLADCARLTSLPPLPSTVFCIDAPNCSSLSRISPPLGVNVTCIRGFNFQNCLNLTYYSSATDRFFIRLLKWHVEKTPLHSYAELSIIMSGNGIEEWKQYEHESCKAEFMLPPDWFDNTFKGVVLWAVFTVDEHARFSYRQKYHRLDFQLKCNSKSLMFDTGLYFDGGTKLQSSYMWLRYIPSTILKKTKFEAEKSRIEAFFYLMTKAYLSISVG